MSHVSQAYADAEKAMEIPPVSERGRYNENPKGIGFWALVREDFDTHERKFFEQGFWALFMHRFGNWRMDQPKLIRAPSTLIYHIMFKLVEWLCGISLWYTTKMGRRVRIWHHSGMMIGGRAVGDDVQIRQNTTFGVAQTGKNDELPIVGPGADIGAGACIAGAIYVGAGAKVGANALVLTDIPDGATAIGNPAQIYPSVANTKAAPKAVPAVQPSRMAAPPAVVQQTHTQQEPTLAEPRDMGIIALLGSANLDYLAMSFAEAAAQHALKVDTYVPLFGQAQIELLQAEDTSALSAIMKDRVQACLIVERAEDLLGEVYTAPLSLAPDDAEVYLDAALAPLFQLVDGARFRLEGPVFVMTLAVMTRSTLGLSDARLGQGRGLSALIVRANEKIAAHIATLSDVILLDTGDMLAQVGRDQAQPGQFWHMGRVPFSTAFGTQLATRVLGGLLALRGQTARILVLDLDNTLWGGVLGEDGIEGLDIGGTYPGAAYRAFQDALKALSQRGIALAVASKNDEDLALQMMSDHPEMALRPADIVTHRIGWSEKAIGIQEMLDEIGLGAASCMFIDDNLVEREKVRKNVPGCIVPAFPDAPEKLADWLLSSPFLECLELTASDLKRTKQYKVRATETVSKRAFENIEDFYRDLGMQLTFEPFGATNQKRVLQLLTKTNQFNATLRRYDQGAVEQVMAEGGQVYAIGVADRHSAYELMGVIVLRADADMKAAYPDDLAIQGVDMPRAWWVDNLLLSCRILGRTVETAIVAWATQTAKQSGASALLGYVIEAPRNTPVRDVYAKSGMAALPSQADLGAGGLYVQELGSGALPLADYFTILDAPPAPVAAAKPTPPPNPASKPAPQPIATPVAAAVPEGAASFDREADLAATFRRTFGLDDAVELESATMDSVSRWDSLGHLKLAMELNQQMGVHLSGDVLGDISTYPALRQAVVAALT
jgi:FkbH-like protein